MIRAQIKNLCTPRRWTKGKSGGGRSFWRAVTARDLNGSWDLQGQGKEEARQTRQGRRRGSEGPLQVLYQDREELESSLAAVEETKRGDARHDLGWAVQCYCFTELKHLLHFVAIQRIKING